LTPTALTVFRLNGQFLAVSEELARPAGLTAAHWQVLGAVLDTALPVSGIARVMGITRQSVQRVADILVAEGLATFEENPGHRRAKLLRLTREGERALAVIQDAQRVWADAIGAAVGEEDLRAAGAVLERVMGSLAATRPTAGE
jgi:DNA-binding MarR family transcriptional regulator